MLNKLKLTISVQLLFLKLIIVQQTRIHSAALACDRPWVDNTYFQ